MRDPFGRNGWLRGGINFHPVAGGEEQRLRATGFFAQDAIDRRMPGETFACLHIRSVVADAYAEKVHQSEWFCERKVIPQSKVSAALKATTQSVAMRRGAVVPRWRAKRIAA